MSETPEGAKRKRRRKSPMPDAMKARAARGGPVERQHAARYPAPLVEVAASGEGWSFENPFRSADEEEWWRLLGEACGTRTKSVIAVFMGQIASLVPIDEVTGVPDEAEIQAALSIVAALKPRNEAEAAQAAQAFALHRFTMRLGGDIAKRHAVDPRAVCAMANLVKAYSGVMDSMRRGRASKTTRQVITVNKNVTINQDNRRLDLGGGGRSCDTQRDAAGRTTRAGGPGDDTPCDGAGTGELIEGKALLCPPEDGGTVPGQGDEGSQHLSNAQRRQADRTKR